MVKLPILEFEPHYKEVVWGGRRLETVLNKKLPDGIPVGESWELVDLATDQSIVASGALKGKALAALIQEAKEELLGDASLLNGRFPLLLKFLDARQTLSVQVHPDEAACNRIGGGARPKTEAWYIIDTDPDAVLYVGLRPGVTRGEFAQAIEKGTVQELLFRLAVKPGDFVFLPAGTIHAIDAGIVLAEVQQSSDTTYRVFDWNRMGLDGKPRQLHIKEALEAIDFSSFGQPKLVPPPSGRPGLVTPFFAMELVDIGPSWSVVLEGEGLLVLMGISGKGTVTINARGKTSTIEKGETRLVPAGSASKVELMSTGLNRLLAVRVSAR